MLEVCPGYTEKTTMLGWYRHQRSTGQTTLTHRSDVFWVHRRQLFWSGKLSPAEHSRCCILLINQISRMLT